MTHARSSWFARAARITFGVAAAVIVLASFIRVGLRPLMAQRLAEGQVQIRVLHWGDNDEDAIIAGLVREFERENPDVRVLRINPGGSAAVRTKLQTMIAAGDPPDVFYLGYENVANLASKGLLTELDEYIERDRQAGVPDAIDVNDVFPAVLNTYRYDREKEQIGTGPLIGMPKDFTTVGFYYNRDLFRRAGVREPSPEGWTWEEFILAARRIGQLEGCYGADFVTWEAMVRIYLWTYGVDVAGPGFREFHLRDPEVIAALERLRGWFFDEARTLASAKTQLETYQEPFLTGNVGMAGPFGRWKVPTYRLITKFDWDFAPLPHEAGKPPVNGILSTAWSIAAGSKNKDAAWRFIRFVSSPRGQALLCGPGLAIPVLRSVAHSEVFSDPAAKPENDAVYIRMAENARILEWPADPQFLSSFRIRLEGVYKSGNRTVADAMEAVERDWTRLSESFEYPRMPWGRVAAGLLIPLGIVLLAAGAWWYRTRPPRLGFRDELAGWALVSPWVIGLAAFTAFPIVLSLLLAFTNWSGMTTLDRAEWLGLNNLRDLVLHDQTFQRSLLITALYALLAVPSGQLVALAAALLLNYDIRLSGVYRSVWYLPSVLAGVGVAVMWKWVFHHEEGLLNHALEPVAAAIGTSPPRWFERDAARWGVVAFAIMNLWMVGGAMMIYLAGLKGIPQELYEAADIDGASRWSRFTSVTLPMLSPVIFFNVIIAIIASFQIFTQVYVMTAGGPEDDTRFYVLYLYNQAFDYHNMGYASMMAWLLLLIVLALTLLVMRGSRRFVYYEALKP